MDADHAAPAMAVVFRLAHRAHACVPTLSPAARGVQPHVFFFPLWFLSLDFSSGAPRIEKEKRKKEKGIKKTKRKGRRCEKGVGDADRRGCLWRAQAPTTAKKGEARWRLRARVVHGPASGRNGASRGVVRSEGKIPRRKEARRHATTTKDSPDASLSLSPTARKHTDRAVHTAH